MALKATIFKADLQVNDSDRDYYDLHKLTLARHPSETDERMMVRLLVFAMHADHALEFAGEISQEDTPVLWKKNLSGEIQEWYEIGQPDEKRIRKACSRSRQVFIYCYGANRAKPWWQGIQSQLQRFDNLNIFLLQDEPIKNLALMAQRTMQLQCSIDQGEIHLADGDYETNLRPEVWMQAKSDKN